MKKTRQGKKKPGGTKNNVEVEGGNVADDEKALAGWVRGEGLTYTSRKRDEENKKITKRIEGLCLVKDFISEEEEQILLDAVEKMEWNGKLDRRTQHSGYPLPPLLFYSSQNTLFSLLSAFFSRS